MPNHQALTQNPKPKTQNRSPHIPDLLNEPWAILPEKLEQIHAIYQARLLREPVDSSVLAGSGLALDIRGNVNVQGTDPSSFNPDEPPPYELVNNVAVIPVRGVIARRMNLFTRISGGVSTELLLRDFQAALADPSALAIVLAIDSPGGSVGGLPALADAIYAARGTKPVIAHAADAMASGAYWIGSSADAIIAEPTSAVGSIGVLTVHHDYSRADEKQGVKRTYITAGRYKALGNDAEPLSDAARAEIQDKLDYIYTMFVDTVARNRSADRDTVLSTMADGRTFVGHQALDAGLIDTIGTIDDAIGAALSRVVAPSTILWQRR